VLSSLEVYSRLSGDGNVHVIGRNSAGFWDSLHPDIAYRVNMEEILRHGADFQGNPEIA
jgi:hypothetical protein